MPALIELTSDACERLVRRGSFGPIALSTPRGYDIVPVNYALGEATVVVHTSPDGILARYAGGAELLFEVELVDHERWHGWSVVAWGRGRVVSQGAVLQAVPDGVRPWPDGDRSCELRLTWDELSGRKVGAAWDGEAAMYSRRAVR